MKKMIIAALMLFSISTFAQSGKSVYNKYSEAPGVSAVYISPAMFRMIGRLPDMEMADEDINLSPIIKSLNGFYLIDSENQEINDSLRQDVETMVKKGEYELMMEVKEDGEIVHIYTLGSEKELTGLVLLEFEPGSCTFICLDGRVSRDQFEDLIAEK